MSYNFPSKKKPFFIQLVDEDGNEVGTASNPVIISASAGSVLIVPVGEMTETDLQSILEAMDARITALENP